MDHRIAWVLNLDAESELEHGSGRTRNRATEARIEGLASGLGGLVDAADLIVWPHAHSSKYDAAGLAGRAWCPTPDALALLQKSGARPPRAPSFDVLRRVNHRRFSFDLGQNLEGASYAEDEGSLESVLGSAGPDEIWLLKRAFGFAGRERRRISPHALSDADERWIQGSFRRGTGLQAEPFVERFVDAAIHGYLDDRGALELGRPTIQDIDAQGAWQKTTIAPEGVLSTGEISRLEGEAVRVADALRQAGYFGAFGIDAFRYRHKGQVGFQPRSEINARYSMGWAIGMAGYRPAAGLP